MKATITVGVSASGKTTWAREHRGPFTTVIERDVIRQNILTDRGITVNGDLWAHWKFKKEDEQEVTHRVQNMIDHAAKNKTDIIMSDTNLTKKWRDILIKSLSDLDYEVECKYFPIASVEVAIERDRKRKNPVGETVIKRQWKQWLELGEEITGIKPYVYDISKPTAIVVDIDGTVATHEGIRSPFEWDKVGLDKPRYTILEIVKCLEMQGHKIVFLSGRDSVCRKETEEWLKKHFAGEFQLYMRKEGDMRKDRVIKEELFWAHVAPYYAVRLAIDDRKQMIHYWTDIGVQLLNVGNVYEDF